MLTLYRDMNISILFGFASGIFLGLFLFKHIQFKGPDSSKIRKNTYQNDVECFRLIPQTVVGPMVYRSKVKSRTNV